MTVLFQIVQNCPDLTEFWIAPMGEKDCGVKAKLKLGLQSQTVAVVFFDTIFRVGGKVGVIGLKF